MKSLENTQTYNNLKSAILREALVSNSYKVYSKVAIKEGFWNIAEKFNSLAKEEDEHFKIFSGFLIPEFQNNPITIENSHAEEDGTTLENLKASINYELMQEDLFPRFAFTASDEGFPDICATFLRISKIEKFHRLELKKLIEEIEDGSLYSKGKDVIWKCLNCGFIIEGYNAQFTCEVCKKEGTFSFIGEKEELESLYDDILS